MESETEAHEICVRGFGEKEFNKEGPFGNGCSFFNAFPEANKAQEPGWYLLCLVNPGNPYPVTEDPMGEGSFKGFPCRTGYQSHFTLLAKDGTPVTEANETSCLLRSITVFDAASILPLFIVQV